MKALLFVFAISLVVLPFARASETYLLSCSYPATGSGAGGSIKVGFDDDPNKKEIYGVPADMDSVFVEILDQNLQQRITRGQLPAGALKQYVADGSIALTTHYRQEDLKLAMKKDSSGKFVGTFSADPAAQLVFSLTCE